MTRPATEGPESSKHYTALTPHGGIEQVLDGIFIVRGSFAMAPLVRIPRTMGIVRRGQSLTLFNAIRVDEEVEAQITALGRVEHLVRLGHLHGCDDAWYLDRHKPKYWSLPGESRRGAPHDATLSEAGEGPVAGGRVYVLKATKDPEAVMWLPDGGGTLITCDAIQNCTSLEHASAIAGPMCRVLGFVQPCTVVPVWRKRQGAVDLCPDFLRLLSLEFANLVTAHGPAQVGGARDRVREGLLKIWPDRIPTASA